MQDNTQDMIAPYVYQEDERIRNRDSTHEIVSKVAYLIGVYRWHFEQSDEPLRLDIYDELDLLKNARILRNLCMVRSAAERWFGKINEQMMKTWKMALPRNTADKKRKPWQFLPVWRLTLPKVVSNRT